jgi:hypothetical protein
MAVVRHSIRRDTGNEGAPEPLRTRRGNVRIDLRRRRLGRGDEQGAEMVELAIAFTLLSLLVFGIIEFGLVFYNHISLNQGVREAARQTAVGCYNPPASGCSSASPTNDIVAYTKDRIGLKNGSTSVHVIFPGSPNIGDEFSVCAFYPRDSITGLMKSFIGGYSFSEVTMRIEQLPKSGPIPTTGGDTDPTGNGWSKCS